MKAFEAWRNKDCTDGINWTDDTRDKEVWRAALEWVRNKDAHVCSCPDCVMLDIDEELEQ